MATDQWKIRFPDGREFVPPAGSSVIGGGDNKISEGGSGKVSDFCPECFKKDMTLKDMAREHKAELAKEQGDREQLRAQLAEAMKRPSDNEAETWKAKVTQLEAEVAKPRDITELGWDEFAKHCQTCPRHEAQLIEFMTQGQQDILSKLTKDEVKPLAEKHGLWPPKPIIIERGKR